MSVDSGLTFTINLKRVLSDFYLKSVRKWDANFRLRGFDPLDINARRGFLSRISPYGIYRLCVPILKKIEGACPIPENFRLAMALSP